MTTNNFIGCRSCKAFTNYDNNENNDDHDENNDNCIYKASVAIYVHLS